MLTTISNHHSFRVTFVVRSRAGRDSDPDQIGRLIAHAVKTTRSVVSVRLERSALYFVVMPPDDVSIQSLAEFGAHLRAMVRSFLEAEGLPVDEYDY